MPDFRMTDPGSGESGIEPAGWRGVLGAVSEGQPIRRAVGAAGGHVALLIDVSSSMSSRPLEEAKIGAENFVKESLSSGYSVALVSFGSTATVECGLTKREQQLQQCILQLAASGSTNMAAALEEGGRILIGKRPPCAICLVTDGYPDDPRSALQQAELLKRRGVEIIVLGTEGADHEFLRKLASCNQLARAGSSRTLAIDLGRLAHLLPGRPARGLLREGQEGSVDI